MRVPIKGTIIPNEYKDIYNFFGIESTCPKDVDDAINEAGNEELIFEINSGGGAIFSGSEIYSRIRTHPGSKKIEVVGFAGSAASVIACAARSFIAPTGMVMIHNVRSRSDGDYRDMDHESQVLQKCNKAIARAYMEKTGIGMEELLKLMDDETWMSAEEAVNKGFVDEVLPAEGIYNGFCTILSKDQIEEGRKALQGKAAEQERLNLIKMEVIND